MKTSEYLKMMREIKDFSFATIGHDGLPTARIIDVMLVEEDCLYFLTARGKEFYSQLTKQKFAALSGMNKNWQMITLRGKVKKEMCIRDSRYPIKLATLYFGGILNNRCT